MWPTAAGTAGGCCPLPGWVPVYGSLAVFALGAILLWHIVHAPLHRYYSHTDAHCCDSAVLATPVSGPELRQVIYDSTALATSLGRRG